MAFSRNEKLTALFKKLTADFLITEKVGTLLITVTDFVLSENARSATAFVSIFPENSGEKALKELNKKIREVTEYFMKHTRMKFVPALEFKLDKGEKNRQRIEELLSQT